MTETELLTHSLKAKCSYATNCRYYGLGMYAGKSKRDWIEDAPNDDQIRAETWSASNLGIIA